MSLFSSILLPQLEKEIIKLEPDIKAFILTQLKGFAQEVVEWAETKLNLDINQDGAIGAPKDEA